MFKRKMESASVPSIFPFVLFQERRSRKQSPSSRQSSVKKLGRGPRHSLSDEKNSSIEARAWTELRPLKRSWEPSAYIYVVRHIKLGGRVLQHTSSLGSLTAGREIRKFDPATEVCNTLGQKLVERGASHPQKILLKEP